MSGRLNCYIPHKQVLDDFRKAVKKQYNGILHTNLGLELETSMINYLADIGTPGYKRLDLSNDNSKSDQVENQPHTQKIKKHDQMLIDYIYSNFTKDEFFSYELMAKFLMENCTLITPATHKRHINLLISLKIIDYFSENEKKKIGKKEIVERVTYYFYNVSTIVEYVSPHLIKEESVS